MPIPLLELDDRKFHDLTDELRSLIPRHAPGWTDHNLSDPGIMLIELFAWLSEAMLYRINRVPEAGLVRLLELLGARFATAQPLLATVKFTPLQLDKSCQLPPGTLLQVSSQVNESGVIFETLQSLKLMPKCTSQPVRIRQTLPVSEQWIGTGSGAAYQLVEIPGRHIVTPPIPYAQQARLTVKTAAGDETWSFVPNLINSAHDARHFTIRPRLNLVSFGDGDEMRPGFTHGRIPPAGAILTLRYRYAEDDTEDDTIRTCEETLGVSNGKPAQSFRMARPFLSLDLQPMDDLTPQLWVGDERWDYQPDFLSMRAAARDFTVEAKRNAVRFGDGDHGKPPPKDAPIRLSYRHTLGAQDAPDEGDYFAVLSAAGAASPRFLQLETWRTLNAGRDSTTLEEVRQQVYAILQPHWRAVTQEDITAIVTQEFPEIARVYCLPGQNLGSHYTGADNPAQTAVSTEEQLGHLGVVVVPQPNGVWPIQPEIAQILAFGPDGKTMVAQSKRRRALVLWNLVNPSRMRAVAELTAFTTPAELIYSPDGQRVAGVGQGGVAWLWNAESGERLLRLSLVICMAFSPDSKQIAMACKDGSIRVYDAVSGVLRCMFPVPVSPERIEFSPDSRYVLVVDVKTPGRSPEVEGGGDVSLWRLADQTETARFVDVGAVKAALFAAEGRRLVLWNSKGTAQIWSTRTGTIVADLAAESPVTAVAVSDDGAMLATGHADGIVRLWGVQQAELLAAVPGGGQIVEIAFGGGHRRLLAVYMDDAGQQHLRWWSVQHGKPTWMFDEKVPHRGEGLILNRAGGWLACVERPYVYVWDAAEARQRTTLYVDWADVGTPWALWTSQPPSRHVFVVPVAADGYTGTLQRLNIEHVAEVDRFLGERRLVTSRTAVMGPIYVGITIAADVVAAGSTKSDKRLHDDIVDALQHFFHPLHGGPDGAGWTPGRVVYESEIYQVIEQVDGVDHVNHLVIRADSHSVAPFHMVRCTAEIKIVKEESG